MQPKKKGYAGRVLAGRRPERRCLFCESKIHGDNTKYCDRICWKQQMQREKLARRPEIQCVQCGKLIDTLSRSPCDLKNLDRLFCDSICVDAYRNAHGTYATMGQRGQEAAREYKEVHGRRYAHSQRSAATSANNQVRPPRAKMRREGYRVWGYEVSMLPNADRTGYVASLPEYPDAGQVEAKTAKEALGKLREKFRAERG